MELKFTLAKPKPKFVQRELLDAASKAAIHTFGWPIGVVMTRAEYRPRPTTEGVVAEIGTGSDHNESFDYWSLRRDGDFYLIRDLFEDDRQPERGLLFINTRIVQVTEALLYCARLYAQLNITPTQAVQIAIRHGGLKGRTLTWVGRLGFDREENYATSEDESSAQVLTPLSKIESGLVEIVKEICAPLFILFNFYEVREETYSRIVDNFVAGRVV